MSVSLQTVLVLGATSAIGSAVARELAAGGSNLVLGGRDETELQALAADIRLRFGVAAAVRLVDLLAFATHARVVHECLNAFAAPLDGAVVCTGYQAEQQLAESDPAVARQMLEVNLTAVVSLVGLLANAFEQRRHGFLCVVTSVAGDRGRRSNYVYGAAKGGLAIYLEGLRYRLLPAGVQVTTVKPGFVDTRLTYGRTRLPLLAAPERVARQMVQAVRRGRAVAYVPGVWRWVMLLLKLLPAPIFRRLPL